MYLEIELKVAINENYLNNLIEKVTSYFTLEPLKKEKVDFYYKKQDEFVRLREVDGKLFLTTKVRSRNQDGIELNKERELLLPIEFKNQGKSILTLLGYTFYKSKKKKGYLWQKENLSVELVEVDTLGWFLEAEFIEAENIDEKLKTQREKELKELVGQFGLSEKMIEKRPYLHLLKEQENGV
ncbi:MAG: class IV adenylate cyclase [Sphaerochaetaceae bacterium]